MAKTAHEIVESQRFKALVRKRWSVSIVLTILLFLLYYGYILVVAWLLTVVYVIWANTSYDREVNAIKQDLI
jgi:uncharacterized membrane protein (DUF485 family)